MSPVLTPFNRTASLGTAEHLRLLALLAVSAVEQATRSEARVEFVCIARPVVQLMTSAVDSPTPTRQRLEQIEARTMEHAFGAWSGQAPACAADVMRGLFTAATAALFFDRVHPTPRHTATRRVLHQLALGERETLVAAAWVLLTASERMGMDVCLFSPMVADMSLHGHAVLERRMLDFLRLHPSVLDLELYCSPTGVLASIAPR
jgi:hypothetical protein